MNDSEPLHAVTEYPYVTRAGFPDGLRCPVCERAIELGQPYQEHFESVNEYGAVTVVLTCVYCTL